MAFTELQLSLAGLGAAAVGGVWAYNKWQERSLRRRAERIFAGDGIEPADAAQEEESVESPRDANREAVAQEPRAEMRPDGRVEPVFEAPVSEAPELQAPVLEESDTHAPVGHEPPVELADAMIDCIVYLTPEQPIAATAFWPAQRVHLGTLDRQLRWLAQDEQGGDWRELAGADGRSCAGLCAALQLADRTGAVGEVQLSKFFIGLRQVGEDFQAALDLPKAAVVLGRAHALDEFCASVDWRIGINVVRAGDAAPDGAGVGRLLESDGFRLDDQGMYRATDANGEAILVVSKLGSVPFVTDDPIAPEGVTLTIDVPRVADGVAAFDRLLVVARQIAVALSGELVDDQRVPLKDDVLGAIRDKIREFQQKMADREIPAGGRRALRLYC